MKILKIWIFTLGGQQLFFKEYEQPEEEGIIVNSEKNNIVPNLLNTGVINSFVTFFNNYLVKKLCDIILFDDILFSFHYNLDSPLNCITLVITSIDKQIDLEMQMKVLKKVANKISDDFCECYREVFLELQHNLDSFKSFEDRCDKILHDTADELAQRLNGRSMKINGF
jgi:hypothetical protein